MSNSARVAAVSDHRHPFAEFLRIVGRGPGRSRSLDMVEAEAAMGMILADEVTPEQLGAFLIIMRYRKETPEELAGFVRAARLVTLAMPEIEVDLDWPSYADRHRQLPYFILAAVLLAENGVRILMHGLAGDGPATTPRALSSLGIAPATSADAASQALDVDNFAYMPVGILTPALAGLFQMRPLLGLRSPANTFARMLNPGRAHATIQGVFHPTYLETHQRAAQLLDQYSLLVFKGGGGEAQRNPEKPCRVLAVTGGIAGEEIWPAAAPGARYKWRDEPLQPGRLRALWRGELDAPVPAASVVATAALALRLLGRERSMVDADRAAQEMWQRRRRDRFQI